MVPGKMGRGKLIRSWTQDIEDTLSMMVHEAGGLAIRRESFLAGREESNVL